MEIDAGQHTTRERMVRKTKPIIVAVDGPAGSGKSSICAKVCELVEWSYLNTGALYRGVGIIALEKGLDLENDNLIANMVDEVKSELRWDSAKKSLSYKDSDLSEQLLTQAAGSAASKVAKLHQVRERLLPVQRDLIMSSPLGALVDGRDIGTVVFPNADLKIFLTASIEERTKRRLAQLVAAGTAEDNSETFERIKLEISRRDTQDIERGEAPLRKADDAIELDTSHMNLEEVINTIVGMLKDRKLVR
mgnify:CR=1 FL=1|jgi:CMP/dCMP kinase